MSEEMKEQKLETTVRVNLDFLDRMKVLLFGKVLVIKVITTVPLELPHFNTASIVSIEGKTITQMSKNLPDYGYTHNK